jgi:hypothetical protein
MLEIDINSKSKFASILHFAPSMALPRNKLLNGMVPILPAGNKEGFNGTWNKGTIFVADHTVIHAGPYQSEPPRVVLFTTFTCNNRRYSTDFADSYNVSDQYLPAHFCEDPSMPINRAIELLKEWKEDQPHLSYPNDKQAKACLALCGNESLSPSDSLRYLECLRH